MIWVCRARWRRKERRRWGDHYLLAILIPVLLFARLDNVYIQLMIISTIWLGLIGFADDYIKVFRKHKEGLKGRFKVIGQVGLGLIVGLTLYMNDEVVIRERAAVSEIGVVTSTVDEGFSAEGTQQVRTKDIKSTKTTIPFLKITSSIMPGLLLLRENMPTSWGGCCLFWLLFYHYSCVEWGESDRWSGWSGYRNVGDYRSDAGNPGLCVGEYGLCRLSEYHVHSAFRRIGGIRFCLYRSDDRVLWYNSYPAQVFMGDTGSLALGGIIAVFAIIIHKELLIPALCGIFLMENLSVVMQVSYFKYTKRKFGEGRRIF